MLWFHNCLLELHHAIIFYDVSTVGRVKVAYMYFSTDKFYFGMLSTNGFIINIDMPLPANYIGSALHKVDIYIRIVIHS